MDTKSILRFSIIEVDTGIPVALRGSNRRKKTANFTSFAAEH